MPRCERGRDMADEQGKIRVAIGTDCGPTSDYALWEALSMLHRTDAIEVHFVHVLPEPEPNLTPRALEHTSELMESRKGTVENWIQEKVRAYSGVAPGFTYFVHVRLGEPSEVIQQVAVDYKVDAIVVGTHGRSGLERFVLGSVAEKLSRNAHCTVIVARPNELHTLKATEMPDAPRPGEDLHSERPEHPHTYGPSNWLPSKPPTGFRIA